MLYFQWDQFWATKAFKRNSPFFKKEIFLSPCPLPLHVMERKILKSCTKKYNVFIHLPITALREKWQHRISKTEASEYLVEWCLEVCLMQETCITISAITTKADIWNCVQQKKDKKKSHSGWWAMLRRYKACSVLKKCAKLTTSNKHSHLVESQIWGFLKQNRLISASDFTNNMLLFR